MNPPRYHIDSNILLRFFTGEPVPMFEAASALIESAERGEVVLELSALVLAETAFTLESFFKQPRKEVAKSLHVFVSRSSVRLVERDRILDALERVKNTGVHLVDAYLAAIAVETKIPVASFDRDFDRIPDMQRFEPKA